MVVSVVFFALLLNGCVASKPPKSVNNVTETTTSLETSAISPSASVSESTDGAPEAAQQAVASESFNIYDVRPDFYYEYMLVDTYINVWIWSVNPDKEYNTDDFKEYLDEKSGIYDREIQRIEDYYSRGISLNLLSSDYEEAKEMPDNLSDIYYSIEYEERWPDKTTHKVSIRRIFTVYNDGEILKIVNIRDNAE
jgi:hypothetical protein